MPTADTSQADMPPTEEAMMAEIAATMERFTQESQERFADLLPRMVHRFVEDPQAAEQALADGGFVLNDSTVVMRLNSETDHVEFFCDVGLPEYHSREAAYRTVLEMNLCRTYPGITLGVHPESGRIVATIAVHSLLMANDDTCISTLEMLTLQVRRLRDSRSIPLEEERAEAPA